MHEKRVLIAISQGFQERIFVKSGLINLISEYADVYIVSYDDLTIPTPDTKIKKINLERSFLKGIYLPSRRLFLWKKPLIGSLKKYKSFLRRNKKISWFLGEMGRLLPKELLIATDRYIMRDKFVRELINEIQPDMVITASPGFHYLDAVLLNEANREGIKSVVVGQSWDNFSTKGYVNPKPDLMICWGEKMRLEAINLQDFDPRKTVIAGAPHFDAYFNLDRFGDRQAVFKKLGLDPKRKLIVYGTSPKIHAPTEFNIVSEVAKLVESSPNSKIKFPTQMIIRLHPQQIVGEYAIKSEIENFKLLEGKFVKLDIPKMIKSKLTWLMDDSEYERLPLLLSHADLAINTFSTFTLDAAAANVPVISTLFDYPTVTDKNSSVTNYKNYIHIKGVIKTGGVKVVKSMEELIDGINRYLENPHIDEENRRELVRIQLYKIDGKATNRINNFIRNLLCNG